MVEKEVKMKIFEKNKGFKVINGNSLEVLDALEPNSIDAIITDPPYELGFMNKKWDNSGIAYNIELWKKALRVLKSGGYLLAFGGTRTYHRIACAIEDAGFEIRDCIMWLYGSGFPKSLNIGLAIDKKLGCSDRGHRIAVANRNHPNGTLEPNGDKLPKYEGRIEEGKKWEGWGTALKPAYEPIIVARKPVEGSVADNVLKYQVGGININECRVGEVGGVKKVEIEPDSGSKNCGFGCNGKLEQLDLGRFPANVILTYDETDEKEVIGGMPNTEGSKGKPFSATDYEEHETATNFTRGDFNPYNDEGSAARYFYCAKASKKDRDAGLIEFEEKDAKTLINREEDSAGASWNGKYSSGNAFAGAGAIKKNIHPTVKPVELMQYLVKLVTPKGGVVLDIFNGSGSTGKAVAFENRERDANYKYIGIELDPEYCRISEYRIDYALNKYQYDIIEEIKENEKKGQLSIFDFTYEDEEGE